MVVALVICGVAAKSQSPKAALVLKKGDVLAKTSDIKSVNKVEMMGQSVESNTGSSIQTIYTVDDAGEDYTLGITLHKLTLHMDAMGQQLDYDSDKPADSSSALGTVAKNIVGKQTHIVVNKSGTITSIDTSAEPNALAGILANIGITGNELAVGNTFELSGSLPVSARLKKVYSWTDSSGNADGKRVSSFVIEAITGNTATVAINGVLTKNGNIEQNGMQLKTKLSGKFSGNMEVDIATNTVLKKNITIHLNGQMDMMGMSVPTTSETTVTELILKH